VSIKIKRIYDPPAASDGHRILVDRLWPRGLTKERATVDMWLKDIAPSTELRHWFNHDPRRWREFQRRYFLELEEQHDNVETLRNLAASTQITLLYAAKDADHNNAAALKTFLLRR